MEYYVTSNGKILEIANEKYGEDNPRESEYVLAELISFSHNFSLDRQDEFKRFIAAYGVTLTGAGRKDILGAIQKVTVVARERKGDMLYPISYDYNDNRFFIGTPEPYDTFDVAFVGMARVLFDKRMKSHTPAACVRSKVESELADYTLMWNEKVKLYNVYCADNEYSEPVDGMHGLFYSSTDELINARFGSQSPKYLGQYNDMADLLSHNRCLLTA